MIWKNRTIKIENGLLCMSAENKPDDWDYTVEGGAWCGVPEVRTGFRVHAAVTLDKDRLLLCSSHGAWIVEGDVWTDGVIRKARESLDNVVVGD